MPYAALFIQFQSVVNVSLSFRLSVMYSSIEWLFNLHSLLSQHTKKKKRIRLALLDVSSYFLINWRARVCVIRTTQIKFRMFLRCRAYLSHIHSICVFTKRYIFWENCAKRCLTTYALCILCKMRRTHLLRWTEKFRWNFLGIDLISFRLSDSSAHMCLHSFRVSCFPYLIWLISRAF